MFIVRGKSDLASDTEVIRDTPADAIETANDLLAQGCNQVTIEADGHVHTVADFALYVIDPGIRDIALTRPGNYLPTTMLRG